MSELHCPHCGATRQLGHVLCGFCKTAYSAEIAKQAIPCPQCRTLSTSDQTKCVGCGGWIVVQCVFCAQLSPHTAPACLSCKEVFAGSAERKARQEAEGDDEDEDEEGWEGDWCWCSKCQALVYDEDPPGRCARGGTHDTSDSEDYYLCVDEDEVDGQGNFRWCQQCQCVYRGGERAGVCPATKGPHDGSDSDEYFVSRDGDEDEDYGGWKVCNKCSTLFWGEDAGACAAGGGHDGKGSSNWEVFHDDEDE